MKYTIEQVRHQLYAILEAEKFSSIEYIEEDKIHVSLILDESDNENELKDQIISLLKIDLEIPKVKYEAEVKKKPFIFENTKKIIVSSGKGGVGKSFFTSNLANTLSKQGFKVAVIDADIYGSSIPMIFDMEHSPKLVGDKIEPLRYENIELIGTSNVTPNNEPIVWRGPMLGRLLKSFFDDVCWSDDIDYLIVDLPPGTGDIPLDLNNIIPDAKCVVVTTPHINASKVAIFAGEIAKMQNHEILGVVENMSYYTHNDEKLFIFGKDGGQFVADSLKTDVLGKFPILPPANNKLYQEDEEAYKVYKQVSEKIINNFEKL